jgi:hypothetical protein
MSVTEAAQSGCTRCQSPIEEGDLRCAVCALPVPSAARTPAVDPVRAQILRCTDCGAAVAFDANKGAPACSFCGAVMKVEQPVDPIEVATRRIPFLVDRDAATRTLRTWLGSRGFFAPRSLRDEAVFESLHPLYWAAWIVDAQASVSWAADSNEGSQRSAWAPHAGVVSQTFDNIVVPASRGLRHIECARLVPQYDLAQLVPIAIDTSRIDDDAAIESFDAQRSAARALVARGIESVARVRVERIVPGSRVRNVKVAVLLERQTTDRVALPAWVLAYRYRGSPYRAVVHGTDARVVFGNSPKDWVKVMTLVIGIASVIALIVLAIALLR